MTVLWDSVVLGNHFDFFVDEGLVGFEGAGEFEGVGEIGFALGDAGDDVRTADPVGFFEVGLRPLRGVVGVGMVEADDVFAAFAGQALDADEFFGIDVVAVLWGIGAGVLAAGGGGDGAGIIVHLAEEDSAAFVGVGFFAVTADVIVMLAIDSEHG
jgi:hypothetical protein